MTPTIRQISDAVCAAMCEPQMRRLHIATARALHASLLATLERLGRDIEETERIATALEALEAEGDGP